MRHATVMMTAAMATLVVMLVNGCHLPNDTGAVSTYGVIRGGPGSFYGGGGGGGRGGGR
jgi:hypothetical protein